MVNGKKRLTKAEREASRKMQSERTKRRKVRAVTRFADALRTQFEYPTEKNPTCEDYIVFREYGVKLTTNQINNALRERIV